MQRSLKSQHNNLSLVTNLIFSVDMYITRDFTVVGICYMYCSCLTYVQSNFSQSSIKLLVLLCLINLNAIINFDMILWYMIWYDTIWYDMSIHWYNLFCNHISFKHSSSIIFLNFGLANALVFQFGNMPSFCQLPYTVSSIVVFLFIYYRFGKKYRKRCIL